MEESPKEDNDFWRMMAIYYLSLYLQFIKIRISSIVSYRGSFIAGIFAQMLSYGASFFTAWLLVRAFRELNGWTPYEVLLLYGMNLLSYALAAFFFFDFSQYLGEFVINGRLDAVLTKPVNPFFYLVCNGFNSAYFSHITVSIFTIIISFNGLRIALSPRMLLMFSISILGGLMVHASALIMTSVPAIWMLRVNLSEVLYWNFREFINYLISIYNKVIQFVLTFVLPYDFINFYPSQLFLGKKDYLFHPYLQYCSLPVGALLFYLSYRFWQYGLNRYQGTGT